MRISEILKQHDHDVITAEQSEPVRHLAARLAEKRIGAVPVVADNKLVGIFSERDIVYGLAAHGDAMLDMPVGEVMTADPVTVEPESLVISALSLMTRRRIRHLPVVANGALVGFVSIGDLVKTRIELIESEAEAMREYIQMV